MSTCKQWREGDENVCTCGYRWDVKEEDPHNFASESKALSEIEEEHQGDRDVAKYERNRRRIKQLKEQLKNA